MRSQLTGAVIAGVRGMLVLACLRAPSPAFGQGVARYTLARRVSIVPHLFSHVTGVFELPDKRLVVADEGNRSVFLVDVGRGTTVPLGPGGKDVAQYKFPRSLLPLGADSVGIEDVGSNHLIVVRPDGTIGGIVGLSDQPPRGDEVYAAPPIAGDTLGRLYSVEDSAFSRRDPNAASSPVMRWAAGTTARVAIAYLPFASPLSEARSQGRTRAFAVRPELAVRSDGCVAIVHVNPYQVQLIAPSGITVAGNPIRYRRYSVTSADTLRWREERRRLRPAVAQTPGGRFVVDMFSFDPSGPVEWPQHLPPFEADAVRFAPDGHLWIQRSVPTGRSALVDVIDGQGHLVARVAAPKGGRLIGFGGANVILSVRRGQQEEVEIFRNPIPLSQRISTPRACAAPDA